MQYDPSDIDQGMLLLYLLDEISDPGRQEVEAWISRSANNAETFRKLKQVWHETGQLTPSPVAVDVDQAWERFKPRIKTRTIHPAYYIAAVAALFAIMLTTGVFKKWFDDSVNPVSLSIESFAEVVFDTLTDGTTIALNESSKLQMNDFSLTERVVELEGEAFFSVAADSSKPFIIHAGLGQIKVLGTEFNVNANDENRIEVVVESGVVELALRDSLGQIIQTLLLRDGDKGILSTQLQELTKVEDLQADELFWANRKLIFQKTSLSKVFELLKKHYQFEVRVDDESILSCLLSTSFTNENIEQIMAVIAASFELELSRSGSQFILTGGGCDE